MAYLSATAVIAITPSVFTFNAHSSATILSLSFFTLLYSLMIFTLRYCTSSHYPYAGAICELIEIAAKQRGTGIAKREPEYIKTKMDNGNAVIALDGSQLDVLFSVERVNELVMSGLSFRDAYIQVGKELDDGSFIPPKDLDHSLVGSMGNLENNRIEKNMKELMQLFV